MLRITLLLFTIWSSFTVFGQSNIKININHLLGDQTFQFDQETSNDMNTPFTVTRMQYYLSGFILEHDGGQVTPINDLYVLVDAGEETTIDLGQHNISHIENLRFSVGVDTSANHLDPASYAEDHPLAPKFPSMHWGWDPGYRFVAMEGHCESSLDVVYQIHALGDVNYAELSLTIEKEVDESEEVIHIDADYTKAVKGIKVEQGLFTHGEKYEAKTLMLNMVKEVFAKSIVSSIAPTAFESINVAPNPSNGDFVLTCEDNLTVVNIYNSIGERVRSIQNIEDNSLVISDLEKGTFFIQARFKDNSSIVKQVIRL